MNQKKKKSSKSRSRKKDRDVNAPKQPLTGYVHFINERRATLRVENPNLSFAEITKILGSEWSRLTTQEKQVRNS